jgi:hypothetical protein
MMTTRRHSASATQVGSGAGALKGSRSVRTYAPKCPDCGYRGGNTTRRVSAVAAAEQHNATAGQIEIPAEQQFKVGELVMVYVSYADEWVPARVQRESETSVDVEIAQAPEGWGSLIGSVYSSYRKETRKVEQA